MPGNTTQVKTEEYAAWLKSQASQCMSIMSILDRGFDEKFSEMGWVERFFNRKLIGQLQDHYGIFDRLLTSFCREYTMTQFVLDEGFMVMEILADNHYNQSRNVAMEIYETLYGKMETSNEQIAS